MMTSRLTLGFLTLAVTVLATACIPNQPAVTPETSATPTPATQPAPEPAATTVPETSSAPASPPTTATATPDRTGGFTTGEHETQGAVTLIAQDGMRKLVFDEAFLTSAGPDLVVVLHQSAAPLEATTPPAYPLNEGDYVVIAPLQSPTGAQEYTIPAEINLEAFQSVAIWCRQFNATFGAATLQ